MNRRVDLSIQPYSLRLTHRWTIASRTGPGAGEGTDTFPVVLVRLRDAEGVEGLGETAPSNRYRETAESALALLGRVDPQRLSFADLTGSLAYLESLATDEPAARCALDIALHDGAARRAGQPLHEFLGLGFTPGRHVTSFSIGLDAPEVIHRKVLEAEGYPILKLKLGSPADHENLAALRAAAPTKLVRVDANEAWKTREEALRELEWLAADGRIEFVEQAMPAGVARTDWEWLKARSPLPLMADESYRFASDLPAVLGCFDAVNVKLVKTGGVAPAVAALRAARAAGLKTMLGCMIETSVLIAAAAHLANLTDYLDLDGNLLVSNDPYDGLSGTAGRVGLARGAGGAGALGLGVAIRDRVGEVFT